MRMELKVSRDVVFDGPVNGGNCFARGDATAIADAKNMGVYGLGRLLPPHVQNDISRFTSNAGQRLECGPGVGNHAVIFIDQQLAEFDDVLGLLPEQADGFDVLCQLVQAQVEHLLGRVCNLEQGAGCFVHTGICGLRREGNGDNKCVDIHMFQLTLGFGFCGMKAREYLAHGFVVELLGHKSGLAGCHSAHQAKIACVTSYSKTFPQPVVLRLGGRNAQQPGRIAARAGLFLSHGTYRPKPDRISLQHYASGD